MPRRIKLSPKMKLSLPHIPKTKDKPSHPLQLILAGLSQNTLVGFKLGFEGDEIRSRRDLEKLVKVISEEYLSKIALDKHSCLESIRIGWRLPRFALGPILQQVVPMLLSQPAQIKLLELNINGWVPKATLQRIVAYNTIHTLDLRSIRIRKRCSSDPRFDRHSKNKRLLTPADRWSSCNLEEQSLLSEDSVVAIVQHVSHSVRTLRIIDCDLRTHHVEDLSKCLLKKRSIVSLSLRHNRRLDGGFGALLSLTSLRSLDLSICDMDEVEGWALCRALSKNRTLQSLSVAGNYRMSLAIPKLLQVAMMQLEELEISFCEIQNEVQKDVFDILASCSRCRLRSLRMQASRLVDIEMFLEVIRRNQSIERLIIDHPLDPAPLERNQVEAIASGMSQNYSLTDLRFDTWQRHQPILDDMQFWLDLNQCGRGIFLQDNHKQSLSLSTVLARAVEKNDPEITYWLLRRGANDL